MNEPWEEAMHDQDGKLIGYASAQGMRYSSSPPQICSLSPRTQGRCRGKQFLQCGSLQLDELNPFIPRDPRYAEWNAGFDEVTENNDLSGRR